MKYTVKIQKAIKFAIKTHDVYQKQKRKGKDIAYITHPLTVGIILSCAGLSEDVIVAGILHDTMEDSIAERQVTRKMLSERFGNHVAKLVESVTEENKNLPWEVRKQKALEHIKSFSHDSLLVKSADTISNVSDIIDDHARYGDEIFSRFNGPKDKVLKNYLKVITTIISCWPENPLAEELEILANLLRNIAGPDRITNTPKAGGR